MKRILAASMLALVAFSSTTSAGWLDDKLNIVKDTVSGDMRHVRNGLNCAAESAKMAAIGGACVASIAAGDAIDAAVACGISVSQAEKVIKCDK